MNRIFLIGDTHFGHRKIIEFEPARAHFRSIQEHDEGLIERWNSVVKKNDTVWHLGDVLFGTNAFCVLPRLNGNKKLVMGNHDHYPVAMYAEHFSKVLGSIELRGCILTHIPVSTCQFPRFKANIHGHKHSKTLSDPRYVCVSAEQVNLTPISLDEVMTRIDK